MNRSRRLLLAVQPLHGRDRHRRDDRDDGQGHHDLDERKRLRSRVVGRLVVRQSDHDSNPAYSFLVGFQFPMSSALSHAVLTEREHVVVRLAAFGRILVLNS